MNQTIQNPFFVDCARCSIKFDSFIDYYRHKNEVHLQPITEEIVEKLKVVNLNQPVSEVSSTCSL